MVWDFQVPESRHTPLKLLDQVHRLHMKFTMLDMDSSDGDWFS